MPKRDGLVRFGVAMEGSLLRAIGALVKQRGAHAIGALAGLILPRFVDSLITLPASVYPSLE